MSLLPFYPFIPNSPSTMLYESIQTNTTDIKVRDATKLIRSMDNPPGLAVIGGNRDDVETILYQNIRWGIHHSEPFDTLLNCVRAFEGQGTPMGWAINTPVARNVTWYDMKAIADNIGILDGKINANSSSISNLETQNQGQQHLIDLAVWYIPEYWVAPSGGEPSRQLGRVMVYHTKINTNGATVDVHVTKNGQSGGQPFFHDLGACAINAIVERDTSDNSESPWVHLRWVSGNTIRFQIKRSNQGGILLGGIYYGNLNNSNSVTLHITVTGIVIE